MPIKWMPLHKHFLLVFQNSSQKTTLFQAHITKAHAPVFFYLINFLYFTSIFMILGKVMTFPLSPIFKMECPGVYSLKVGCCYLIIILAVLFLRKFILNTEITSIVATATMISFISACTCLPTTVITTQLQGHVMLFALFCVVTPEGVVQNLNFLVNIFLIWQKMNK